MNKENAEVSQCPNSFYRVSLKALIRNSKGEILVNKEQDGTAWSLPGGGWDYGKTEHEALTRELHEEVGYDGEFDARLVSTVTFWLESKRAWLLWIVFVLKTRNQNFFGRRT